MTGTPELIRPVAVLGGTFDPVHLGHLRSAWEAAERLDAELYLMPANQPPHRPQPVGSPGQRLALLQAALAGQSRLRIDARELQRSGPSYSVDTLRELRAEIGAARSLTMLVGADAFAGLSTWHAWQELFDLAHVGVLTRPGQASVTDPALLAVLAKRQCSDVEQLRCSPAGLIFPIQVTALQISATAVRAELASGRVPRYLLSDAVLALILEQDWYRGNT